MTISIDCGAKALVAVFRAALEWPFARVPLAYMAVKFYRQHKPLATILALEWLSDCIFMLELSQYCRVNMHSLALFMSLSISWEPKRPFTAFQAAYKRLLACVLLANMDT